MIKLIPFLLLGCVTSTIDPNIHQMGAIESCMVESFKPEMVGDSELVSGTLDKCFEGKSLDEIEDDSDTGKWLTWWEIFDESAVKQIRVI